MRHRHRLGLASAATLAASLVVAATALAGGWASATLDAPPEDPIAGEPIVIGFTLLQHGITPVDFGAPTVSLLNAETGEEVTVTARREGGPGHWVAEITIPSAGVWEWQVRHDLEIAPQGFTPISVAPAAIAAPVGGSPVAALLAGLGAVSILAGLVAVRAVDRARRRRLAGTLAAARGVGAARG